MTTSTHVEILVGHDSLEPLRDAVGAPSWARFRTAPSRGRASRMVLGSLDMLRTADAFDDLDDLQRLADRQVPPRARPHVPVVLVSTGGGALRRPLDQALLLHWFRRAPVEPYIATDALAVRRMLLARRHGAEADLVASASLEGSRLVVWSCEPRRFEVPISSIPALARMTPSALARLQVSASGSRVHWPDADVDLDLGSIRAVADPKVRRAHEATRRRDAARYADAIRTLREERGIKQSAMGLSERQVRRLERGDTIPHSTTLRKLAAAHGTSVEDYLAELAKRSGARGSSGVRRRR